MSIKKSTLFFCSFLILFFISGIKVFSDMTPERAIALSKKLNNMNLQDYSEYLLKKAIQNHPDSADKLRIELASTYLLWNKPDKGKDIIAGIPKDSKLYPIAQYEIGYAILKKGRFKESTKYLKSYINKTMSNKPSTDNKVDCKRYLTALNLMKWVHQKHVVNPRIASKYADMLASEMKRQQGAENKESATSDIERLYNKIEAEVTSAEKMKQKNIAGWKPIMRKAIAHCEDEFPFDMRIGTFAAVLKARCLFHLGQYNAAVKSMKGYSKQLKEWDKIYRKEFGDQGAATSPMADARYWQGRIFMAEGDASQDNKKKTKKYLKALTKFYSVLKNHEGYKNGPDAYSRLLKLQEKIKKICGRNAKVPDDFNPPKEKAEEYINPEGVQYYREKKYSKALPFIIEAIHKDRNNKKTSSALYKLLMAYYQTGKKMNAIAIGRYLADTYPKTNFAALGLVQLGQCLWQDYENAKDPKKKRELKMDAIRVWEDYIRIAPGHQYASGIAMKISMEVYNDANALMKKANKLPQGKEKQKTNLHARESFKQAIPYFRRVIKNYSSNLEYAQISRYLLGQCYSLSKQYPEAVDAYLKYIKFELGPEVKNKDYTRIANAKFSAGDSLFKEGKRLDDKADELRDELEKEAIAEEKMKKSATSETTREMLEKKQNKKKKSAGQKGNTKTEKVTSEKEDVQKKSAEKTEQADERVLKIRQLDKESLEYFMKSVKQFRDFIKMTKSGELASNSSNPKIKKYVNNAYFLICWAFDNSKQPEKAAANFKKYLELYEKTNTDKKIKKRFPQVISRLGIIYAQMGDDKKAEYWLEKLANDYPESEEAKGALFLLAKSMYENKSYIKCITIVKRVFKEKKSEGEEITTRNLKWISNNMMKIRGSNKKEAAALALKTYKKLLRRRRIEGNKIKLNEWFNSKVAQTLANNPAELKKQLAINKQRLLFNSAEAAYAAGETSSKPKAIDKSDKEYITKAIEYLSRLLQDDQTPYLYNGLFLRAEAYMKIGEYDKARKDLAKLSQMANMSRKFGIYNKAMCMSGDSFLAQKNYRQAFASFNIIAASAEFEPEPIDESLSEKEKKKLKKQRKEEMKWAEYALFKATLCAAKIGEEEIVDKNKKKYKKNFPGGKFIREIISI